MAHPFFTIGHSTCSIEEFVDLLRNAEVRRVVDVRTMPRSRTNPQYNSDALPAALQPFQIDYEHIAALGGLRGRKPDIASDVNAFWQFIAVGVVIILSVLVDQYKVRLGVGS